MSADGAPRTVAYEAPSATVGAAMLAICHTEFPAVFGWLMGYAATGVPPSKPRGRAAHGAPDQLDSDGAGNVRSIVGGGR